MDSLLLEWADGDDSKSDDGVIALLYPAGATKSAEKQLKAKYKGIPAIAVQRLEGPVLLHWDGETSPAHLKVR